MTYLTFEGKEPIVMEFDGLQYFSYPIAKRIKLYKKYPEIDKLLFGTIVGIIAVGSSFSLSDYIKKKKGKGLFPYQGVLFMIVTLLILSGGFWIIIR